MLQKGHLSKTFCKIKDTITSKTTFHCRKRMLTANPDFRAPDKSDNLAVVRRLSPQNSGFQDDLSVSIYVKPRVNLFNLFNKFSTFKLLYLNLLFLFIL